MTKSFNQTRVIDHNLKNKDKVQEIKYSQKQISNIQSCKLQDPGKIIQIIKGLEPAAADRYKE